jgi:hypothetical protein
MKVSNIKCNQTLNFNYGNMWKSHAQFSVSKDMKKKNNPGRALIHIFSNPSATEEYLIWGYVSKKLEFFTPYLYK